MTLRAAIQSTLTTTLYVAKTVVADNAKKRKLGRYVSARQFALLLDFLGESRVFSGTATESFVTKEERDTLWGVIV